MKKKRPGWSAKEYRENRFQVVTYLTYEELERLYMCRAAMGRPQHMTLAELIRLGMTEFEKTREFKFEKIRYESGVEAAIAATKEDGRY